MIEFRDKTWCIKSLITEEDCKQFRIDEAYFIAKYHEREIEVTPKAGSFWLIDHWESYGHADTYCEKCGEYFAQHYTNRVLCGTCFCKFISAYYAISEFETNKRFREQQEAYKNRNKPIQLTIKL